jgi:transposase
MRTQGAPDELERRRRLAVERVLEGYAVDEVAAFLDVSPRTVWRWLALYHGEGLEGLTARPAPGRPRKLTPTQEKIALRWLHDDPTEHGFPTKLWTAPRLAHLIQQEFGIPLNPRYLNAWLRDRGFTSQKPQRVARERNSAVIEAWLAADWPRIKKRHDGEGRRSP